MGLLVLGGVLEDSKSDVRLIYDLVLCTAGH